MSRPHLSPPRHPETLTQSQMPPLGDRQASRARYSQSPALTLGDVGTSSGSTLQDEEGPCTDFLVTIREYEMLQIEDGIRNYYFFNRMPDSPIERIWCFVVQDGAEDDAECNGSLEFVCEVGPLRIRGRNSQGLIEDGIMNLSFNDLDDPEMDSFPFAFRIASVWRLNTALRFEYLKAKFGFASLDDTNDAETNLISPMTSSFLKSIIWHEQDFRRLNLTEQSYWNLTPEERQIYYRRIIESPWANHPGIVGDNSQ
ncbi:hypothetical protein SISNIDRAFT_493948 [Sistotremastrum niveocremeum HHB9708]|uniref:Uncharacterized protein n=1 Tax=Sistotremastrum niveocremeum HHB9708 TaxID=1314777 RepID=A0A164XYR7_9AGAM|nr:hypothetical protein SISNIDRAFT_493948 [Sistotremastrum niveocremeum HHB9708]